MLQIPGYYYDEEKKRYFKETVKASASKSGSENQKNPKKSRSEIDVPVKNSGNRGIDRCSRLRVPSQTTFYDRLATSDSQTSLTARSALRTTLLTSALSRLSREEIHEPDLPIGDSITRLTFKPGSEDEVYFGTTYGHVGHGSVSDRPKPIGHNVSNWRTEFIYTSPITSLKVHNDWMLATCFGPQAKAIFSSTNASAESASVTMAPKKTSLWSSSLHNGQIALGCDKQILFSSSPLRSETRSFGTGSAVFALHQQEHDLLAGTRSGHLRLFDLRTATTGHRDARPEILLRAASSITHVRPLRNDRILLALMNGNIHVYDRRFIGNRPEPVLELPGHVNTHTTGLGLDIFEDKLLAAAGEDSRVRIWSLKTGVEVRAGDGLTSQTLEAPINALAFRDDATSRVPKLWLADGCQLVKYAVPI